MKKFTRGVPNDTLLYILFCRARQCDFGVGKVRSAITHRAIIRVHINSEENTITIRYN